MEGGDGLWTGNAAPVACIFQNKAMYLLKIMLIYDDSLLSGQPPFSSHLLVPRWWSLNGGWTVLWHHCYLYSFLTNRPDNTTLSRGPLRNIQSVSEWLFSQGTRLLWPWNWTRSSFGGEVALVGVIMEVLPWYSLFNIAIVLVSASAL